VINSQAVTSHSRNVPSNTGLYLLHGLHNGDPHTGVWLGGSDNGHARRWAWLPTGQLVQWFDWGPGPEEDTSGLISIMDLRYGAFPFF
jgi:hypothetical protein